MLAGLANQICQWDKSNMYCGRCGKPFELSTNEFAKVCPRCQQLVYPRLSPAVIVAITKHDKLLLAHSPRFPKRFYSVLAGFVEAGESLEETLRREIREEVGIEVKNIKYFGSQPWPFPNSLMLGFNAEWKSGDIQIDGEELDNARWFSRDELEDKNLPSSISIASKLIDGFLRQKNGRQ